MLWILLSKSLRRKLSMGNKNMIMYDLLKLKEPPPPRNPEEMYPFSETGSCSQMKLNLLLVALVFLMLS